MCNQTHEISVDQLLAKHQVLWKDRVDGYKYSSVF